MNKHLMSNFTPDENNSTTTVALTLIKPPEEDSIMFNSNFRYRLGREINKTKKMYFTYNPYDDEIDPPLPPKLRRTPNSLILNNACKIVSPGDWICVMDKNPNEKTYIYLDDMKSYWYIITSDEDTLSDREIIYVDYYYYDQNIVSLPHNIENIMETLQTYILLIYPCKYILPEYQKILSAVVEYSDNPSNQKYDPTNLSEYFSAFDKNTNEIFIIIINNKPWLILFERFMNNKYYFLVKSDSEIVYLVETSVDMLEISNIINL
jgi:hypothetical protein